LREEFLTLGPMAAKTLGRRPQAVRITYPVPETLHSNPVEIRWDGFFI
jgi:hypothetical protein